MSVDEGAWLQTGRLQTTVALMVATVMQAFDATIVNVALPQLRHSLGADIAAGSWVVTSYLCATAVTAPMSGWARRRYGARKVFITAISLFVAASLLCAAAGTTGELILFRLAQGFAAGVIQPLAQAILLDISPKREHGRMLAIWGAAVMIGPVVGPTLGGLITDFGTWRWVFAINLPLGLIAITGVRWLPSLTEQDRDISFDGLGIGLLVLGAGTMQLALQRSIGRHGLLLSPEVLIEAAVAVGALALLWVRSSRSRFNVLRLEVFRDLSFSVASAYNFVVSGILFATIVFVPAIGEGPLGFAATTAGLTMSPRAIATMATMAALGYLIDRVDRRLLLAAGLLIQGVALANMSALPPAHAVFWLGIAGVILGIGAGLLFTPMSVQAFSTLPERLRTDAAGIYTLLRQLGSAAGVSVMTAVVQLQIQAPSPPTVGDANAALFHAYTGCFWIMALASLAMLPGVLLFRSAPEVATASSRPSG